MSFFSNSTNLVLLASHAVLERFGVSASDEYVRYLVEELELMLLSLDKLNDAEKQIFVMKFILGLIPLHLILNNKHSYASSITSDLLKSYKFMVDSREVTPLEFLDVIVEVQEQKSKAELNLVLGPCAVLNHK
jgi:hypothetical protein